MLQGLSEFIDPIALIWNHKLFTIAGVKLSFGNVLVALILLLFAGRLSKLVTKIINSRLIEPFVHDKGSQNTYRTFSFYVSLAIFVIMSLTIAGIPLTVFTVVGGALAIGVGFGSQNIVNNFISGIILLVEKPIKIGDIVELDNISGSVQAIRIRSTQVKNGDGKIFVVPNSFFLEKSVLNWSYSETVVRTVINFGVAYGTDVKLVEGLAMNILLNTEGVKQDPIPLVLFENFGESTLDFQLQFWCDTKDVNMAQVRSDIRFKIDDHFKKNKIEMAFPQRDINLRVNRALEVKVLS
ncbi:mechanosensitive ion channel family protein [Peredibacter sp. HCB2-198]|uniref:mechanosensitive ion channel family protein n=1 Tax=Peredibacter sp. HCB2-198 TaxID=3383025 RepID=UPI0038B4622C